jgi:hypothetical protein
VDVSEMLAAMARAREGGISAPVLRLGDFSFAMAPAGGVNPGAVYVKRGRAYLGKIVAGRFRPVAGCDLETAFAILAAAVRPLAAAVAYGRATGRCSCCGRPLTNDVSIRLGIGPICRGRYFGGED